jgi:hypothetical protein
MQSSNSVSNLVGLKLVIQHSERHYTFKCKMRKFLELKMLKWKYNRPPNQERVEEIGDSLNEKNEKLSFIFQCIYNKEEHGLELIDGMHRYHAIKYLSSILEDNEENEWFYCSVLLIEAKVYNTEDKEVKVWFSAINNCIPVPDLYIDPDEQKREIVEEVVNKYYSVYTTHFRGVRPNIPNTNTERFTKLICFIYEQFDISIETKKNIYRILEDINKTIEQIVSNDDPTKFNKKITQRTMEICYKTKMYLFLATKEKLYQMITDYKL